eukprot:2060948-Alexandrium_andersonii.AAC.1
MVLLRKACAVVVTLGCQGDGRSDNRDQSRWPKLFVRRLCFQLVLQFLSLLSPLSNLARHAERS